MWTAYQQLILAATVARVVPSRHHDSATAILGINDLHIHKAWAQAEVVQVVSDDCGEVVVVCTISVAI